MTQLVVLAGGLGTRLEGAIPIGTPKPMASVGGRPFLEHVLERFIDQGVDDVVMLVGHQATSVSEHFGERFGGVHVRYSVETTPLGTGGAILNAARLLSDHFVLANGDTYAEVDVRRLVAHLDQGPLAMSLTPVDDVGRFGSVAVEDETVVSLAEKATTGSGLINAGIYACRTDLFTYFPRTTRFSLERDVLEPHLATLRPHFEPTGAVFFDIGVPTDLRAADLYFS